jgi:hypothetical protein
MLKLGRPWTALIQNLHGTPGISVLTCRRMVSNLTVMSVVRILADQFSSCLTICHPTNVWNKVLYSLPLSFRVLRNRGSKCWFNLHAAYLSSIYDYLAYDKFSSWCAHGWLNCPICMDDIDAFRLEHGRKVSFFDCHRRFLSSNHKCRNDTHSFLKDKTIRKGPLKWKFGADIIQMLDDL